MPKYVVVVEEWLAEDFALKIDRSTNTTKFTSFASRWGAVIVSWSCGLWKCGKNFYRASRMVWSLCFTYITPIAVFGVWATAGCSYGVGHLVTATFGQRSNWSGIFFESYMPIFTLPGGVWHQKSIQTKNKFYLYPFMAFLYQDSVQRQVTLCDKTSICG